MAVSATWVDVVAGSVLRLSRDKAAGEPDLGITVTKALDGDPSHITTVTWSAIEAGTTLGFPKPGEYTVAVEVTRLNPASKPLKVTFHGYLSTPAGNPPPDPNKAQAVQATVRAGQRKGFAYYYLSVI